MDFFNYEINSENIIKILEKNFRFEVCDDPLISNQLAIKIPSHEAFSLSVVQGATYLEKPMGISFKDRLEVFIHRGIFQNNKYIYSPGLFSRDIHKKLVSGNSPYEIFSKFPRLNEDKILIFRSSSGLEGSNIEMKTFSELTNKGIDPSKYLLFKISDHSTYLEPFFEYLACKAFDNLGYFTESQTPWFQQSYEGLTGGIPDFSVFYIREFDELKKKKLLPPFLLLQNLSTLFLWRGTHKTVNVDYSFFIGEVKSSKIYRNSAFNQLKKYSKVNLANKGFATLYNETEVSEPFGLINIQKDFSLNISDSKDLVINPSLQNQDRKWIIDCMKMYLIANISFASISDFIYKKTNKNKHEKLESFDMLTMLNKTSLSEIIDLISSNM